MLLFRPKAARARITRLLQVRGVAAAVALVVEEQFVGFVFIEFVFVEPEPAV